MSPLPFKRGDMTRRKLGDVTFPKVGAVVGARHNCMPFGHRGAIGVVERQGYEMVRVRWVGRSGWFYPDELEVLGAIEEVGDDTAQA